MEEGKRIDLPNVTILALLLSILKGRHRTIEQRRHLEYGKQIGESIRLFCLRELRVQGTERMNLCVRDPIGNQTVSRKERERERLSDECWGFWRFR